MPANELSKVAKDIAKASAKLDTLRQKEKELLGHTVVTCGECKTEAEIRDLIYIQTHWYVSPRGCTEGDYWREGEGQYDCSACKSRLRLYKHPEIMALKSLFKGVVDEY